MIGLYGGTFDPVHFGHLRSALEVWQQCALSHIEFLPCRRHAFAKSIVASDQDRLAMLEVALADYPQFRINTFELGQTDISYTIDTLTALQKLEPDQQRVFILGMDAFQQLDRWHRWQDLIQLTSLIVIPRPGAQLPKQGVVTELLAEYQIDEPSALQSAKCPAIYVLKVPMLDIASSYIREQLAQQQQADFLLPQAVIDYISAKNLYNNDKEG